MNSRGISFYAPSMNDPMIWAVVGPIVLGALIFIWWYFDMEWPSL